MSNYWKKKLDELNNAKSSSSSTKSGNYWQDKMTELEETKKKKDEANKKKNEDIAPTKSTLEQALEWHASLDGPPMADLSKKDDLEDKDKRTWFQKGAFEDGVTADAIIKGGYGTTTDSATDIATGFFGAGEKIVDWFAGIAPYILGGQLQNQYDNPAAAAGASAGRSIANVILGNDISHDPNREIADKAVAKAEKDATEFIKKDLYDEKAVANEFISRLGSAAFLSNITQSGGQITQQDIEWANRMQTEALDYINNDMEADSVLGDKSDSLMQSAGQLGATAVLSAAHIPWWVTTGTTSWGGEMENALNNGATLGEANISGFVTAGADILTEKISGGIKLPGMGKTLDDALTSTLAANISSKFWRTAAKLGMDITLEGAEEWVAQDLSTFGQWLTYQKEEDLWTLLTSEEAMDAKIEAFLGGSALGGFGSVSRSAVAKMNGVDYTTGLTENEQKVVEKVFNDAVNEAKKEGTVTAKKKTEIYNEVLDRMEKGDISTDTIEEVLGGETYKSYKDTIDSEDAQIKQLEDQLKELEDKPSTVGNTKKYDSLQSQLDELKNNSQRIQLKMQLSEEVFGLTKDSRLVESYNERGRRSQAFEADLTQYDAKQQAVIQKAVDSGILNNTRRTHEFVDMVAKISADKGVLFDFTDNKKLKESSFAVDGKFVNGYFDKKSGTIGVNIDSAKAVNTVVGHEITHVLEGTEFYDTLKDTIVEYAKSKGDYQGRIDSLNKLYDSEDVDTELVADLVGDYLFTDSDFIHKLSAENRNVFQKIYDEIKYLCKVATAGSKEARELEKVKKAFEDAYRAEGKTDGEVKHSLSDSDGKQLTTEQQEFFKESKVRDDKGNLLKVYHGSKNSGFNVFRYSKDVQTGTDYGEAYYFTSDRQKASGYSYDVTKDERVAQYQADREALKKRFLETHSETDKDAFLNYRYEGKKLHELMDDEAYLTDGGEVKEVYLNLKNPLIADAGGKYYYEVYPEYFAKARKNGNDGIIVKNVIDNPRGEARPIDTYVAFNPNQIKNTDNTNPTSATDIRYSISDSDGKELTEEQQDYFKDSKMRDENGNLKVMYHGSQDAGFHIFDSSMSDDDTSFFFVDRNDVAASYSGTTETYEARTIRTAEDMNNFIAEIDAEGYEVVEKDGKFTLLYEGDRVADSNTAKGIYEEFCWYEGVGEGDANYKVYLNLKNPLVVDVKGRNWNNVSREFSQEIADRYNSLTADEKAALHDLTAWGEISVFRDEINNAIDLSAPTTDETAVLASAYYKIAGKENKVNMYDLFSIAEDNFSEEAINQFAVKQMNTRDYAQKAKAEGYDGVIFDNIVDVGGYGGEYTPSTVAIAFDSNQIKSVANDKPTADPDIRYSLTEYTDEEKTAHNKAVLDHFGKTYRWAETGYILLDGTKLDLSGKHEGAPGGYRTVDHRDIVDALGSDYGDDSYSGSLVQFMSEGNIRISPESDGINLSVKPNKSQEAALVSFIQNAHGEVLLDIDDTNGNTVVSVEYPSGTSAFKVLNDIRGWFDNGTKPEVSNLSQFRYSLSEQAEYAPTFYSQMARVVDDTRQQKLGAASIVNMLRGKGVKAEEIKWSGIEEWLEGKKSVTKEELQEFIKGSQLQIEETVLGDGDGTISYTEDERHDLDIYIDTQSRRMDWARRLWQEAYGEEMPLAIEGADDVSAAISREIIQRNGGIRDFAGVDAMSEAEQTLYTEVCQGLHITDLWIAQIRERAEARQRNTSETHWGQYKLDGGENYREYLFKMPGSDYRNQAMDVHWKGETGVLAHARVQDFDTADGKMLFVEEIQSDWHNEGQKKGYRKPNEKTAEHLREESDKAYAKFYDAVEKMVYDNANWEDDNAIYSAHPAVVVEMFYGDESYFEKYKFTEEQKENIRAMVAEEAERQEMKKSAPSIGAAPDAPFKGNYQEYVLKKLIREAAEKGYDSIGWTTADIQSDRWSKDYAEGYRIEYDQDIPKFLAKYGKKWGAKVGKTDVQTKQLTQEQEENLYFMADILEDGEGYIRDQKGVVEVWSMPITDAMKQSVLYEGQPMYSLSEEGQRIKDTGGYKVYAKDILLDKGTQENIAPVPKPIAPVVENATVTQEEMQELFPDNLAPVERELDKLYQQKEILESRMQEAIAAQDVDAFNQVGAEYDAVMGRLEELEATENERADSLMNEEAPPEKEELYNEDAKPLDPFANRSDIHVKDSKSYQEENPEAKPFFMEAARVLLGDIESSTPGKRIYNDQLHYESGGEKGWMGQSRQTPDDVGRFKDTWGNSWEELRVAAEHISQGRTKTVLEKRLEFLLNDRMLNGYTDIDGQPIPRNQDYIDFLSEQASYEARQGAFDSLAAPIAPVTEENTVTAPIAEKYEAIKPKPTKEPRMARATPEEQARTAKILFDQKQTPKQKSAWKWAREHIFSRGSVFEDMSLKTGNRELQAKFDKIRRAESMAQTFIGEGKGNAKALVDVRKAVEDAGKTEDFNYYLYHLHNVDRMTLEQRFKDVPNKSVFGDSVDAEVSRKAALGLEILNPEFKQWAEDVYAINKHLRQMMVEEGIISQETADLWQEMYPHYVPISRADANGLNVSVPLDTKRTGINAPIKKATGGNSDFYNVFDTMGSRIEQTYKAIAKNRFGVELMNTLGTAYESDVADIDTVLEAMDTHEELLQEGKNGESPSFTVFQNGERVKFAITEDMYNSMKPSQFTYTNEALRKINDIRRDILTTYSPTFALTNPIKDVQDILLNSQHPVRTYAAIPEAIYSMISKNEYYQERMENGGKQDSYFDGQTKTFKKEDGLFKKVMGFVPSKIQAANEFIEQVPRMAEYIASRKMGRSIDVSMLDAARVTTNFGATGDLTNMLNRNGFTFLGASVEGFNQQIRNVREAKAEGAKGWAKLAGKYLAAGLPALLLNHALWDDDEEYEELSDYVKQNYYVVAKTEDGKFIRIPKGRAVSVIQDAFQQMENLITGNDDVDLESFGQLVINNLAPNNPLENNIIAPIFQAATNKTWYGDDLVPTRLQDVPVAEQFDETTDSISKWLGETFNISPYKANYVLDQYSGGVGDMILPILTPEADGGGLGAAFKDKFVTDPVLKNQNVTDFYNLKDELTVKANGMNATDEDDLRAKYMNSISSEVSALYQQKREVQNSNLADSEKYAKVKDIQKQIVDMMKNGMDTYQDISYEDDYREGGKYARIGDKVYKWYVPGEDSTAEPGWQKLSDEQLAKYETTKAAGNAAYATDGTNHYRWYVPGEDAKEGTKPGWKKVTDDQLKKQKKVTSGLGISPEKYWGSKEEYDFAYENPGKYAVSKAVADDFTTYNSYKDEINTIKKNHVGEGEKDVVTDHIFNNLDLDYGQKIILYRSMYSSKADKSKYNAKIVNYLDSRDDISYEEMVTILEELDMTMKNGYVTWD